MTALTNGNYVVADYHWHNGAAVEVGAVTWGSGASGVNGVISAANSLVGSTFGDAVGSDGVVALTNGSYVIVSRGWYNGPNAWAGAATWGSGTTGVTGVVSAANSLVGSSEFDGSSVSVTALSNGNYVVAYMNWSNGAIGFVGAVTWGSGTGGVTGVISPANSLIGSTELDDVGWGGVTALSNGNYVVHSFTWRSGGHVGAGAATWGNGTTGTSGVVSSANSLVGTTANAGLRWIVVDDVNRTFIAPFLYEGGGRVRVGPQEGQVAAEGGGAAGLALEGVRPNPTHGRGLHVAFALPTGAAARLELVDVSGRRVLAREVGSLGAGQHSVNLTAGSRVASGIYWVRLTQGANRRTTRVAVIE